MAPEVEQRDSPQLAAAGASVEGEPALLADRPRSLPGTKLRCSLAEPVERVAHRGDERHRPAEHDRDQPCERDPVGDPPGARGGREAPLQQRERRPDGQRDRHAERRRVRRPAKLAAERLQRVAGVRRLVEVGERREDDQRRQHRCGQPGETPGAVTREGHVHAQGRRSGDHRPPTLAEHPQAEAQRGHGQRRGAPHPDPAAPRREAQRRPEGDQEEGRVRVPIPERELERPVGVQVVGRVLTAVHADHREHPRERPGERQRDERQVRPGAEQIAEPEAEAEGDRVGEDALRVLDRDLGRRAPDGG